MRSAAGAALELRGGQLAGRFYLEGERLRGGDAIELATFGGGWVLGRFYPERCPMRATLYVAVSNGESVHFVIPEGALVRRPASIGESFGKVARTG